MKFLSKSGNVQRSKQPLIQTLESRQLMSVTTGFDMSHASPPPPHPSGGFEHVFTLGQSSPEMGGSMNPQPFFHGGADGTDGPDPAWLQSQFAHAIAQGASVSITPTTPQSTGTTLSALYSSLGSSTVNQIDASAQSAATEQSAASVINDAVIDGRTSATLAQSASVTESSSAVSLAGATATQVFSVHETVPADAAIVSDKALAQAMSVVTTPLTTAIAAHITPPTWEMLRKLEDDLSAVRSLAGAVVAELGRESVIALSHLQDLVEWPASNNIVQSLSGWRSATAITGAVITAVAYVQSEAGKSEDKKKASVFSSQLIDVVELQ